MANSITLAEKFLPMVDEIYKEQSVTECLDTTSQLDVSGADEVQILKVSTTGLGDYSRANGYPVGDVTAAWETLKLTKERGKEFSIDRMDDEEMLGIAFGALTGSFVREQVVPELDAYRFSTYASTSGITSKSEKLTGSTVLAAIDEATRQMDEDEVPQNGRILFVSSELKPILNSALTRSWTNEGNVSTVLTTYNDMVVKYVPKGRFYSKATINTGSADSDGNTSWGYSKASDAKDINFMIIYPPSVVQVKKVIIPKIFTPDQNQEKDAWKFQFRLYHDAFVLDNKKKGVYLHTAATTAA